MHPATCQEIHLFVLLLHQNLLLLLVLAKGLSKFFINGQTTFMKGPRKLSNLPF